MLLFFIYYKKYLFVIIKIFIFYNEYNLAKKSNPNNIPYYSEMYMIELTGTKSLKKLEVLPESDPAHHAIAAYVFYNKKDRVNKLLHPKLVDMCNEYESLHTSSRPGKNKYKETFAWISFLSNKSFTEIKEKKIIQKSLKKYINNELITMNAIATKTSTSYPAIFNFLKNDKFNSLSIDKLQEIYYKIYEIVGDNNESKKKLEDEQSKIKTKE